MPPSTPFDAVVLRACTVQDAPALALVAAATFLEAFAGTLDGQAIITHCARQFTSDVFSRYFAQPACRVWLAETAIGAAPVGYAMLTEPDLPLPDLGPGDTELKRIYLFSRFHGGGAGQALLSLAIDEAEAIGMKRLLLGVYRGNLRALGFYRRNGFVEVGTRRFTVGTEVYNDLVLGRPLSGSEIKLQRARTLCE